MEKDVSWVLSSSCITVLAYFLPRSSLMRHTLCSVHVIVVALVHVTHVDEVVSTAIGSCAERGRTDSVRTNRMMLTDVNTGKEISTFLGDLNKDVDASITRKYRLMFNKYGFA